jgi:hypothetical protein
MGEEINTSLAVRSTRTNDLASYDIRNSDDIAFISTLLENYIHTNKGGITSIAEGFVVLNKAKELNLPFSMCAEHIHIINGKTGIDVHGAKALLLRAGVVHKWLRKYTPLYEYTDGYVDYDENKVPDYYQKFPTREEAMKVISNGGYALYPVIHYSDLNGQTYTSYGLNSAPPGNFVMYPNAAMAHGHTAAKKPGIAIFRIPTQPIDYISEVEFTRYMNVWGKIVKRVEVYSFTWSEAVTADLAKKDVWLKYPQLMLQARAYGNGAKDIADDVMCGMPDLNELKEIEGIEITDADVISID